MSQLSRTLTIALALVLSLTLTACSGGGSGVTEDEASGDDAADATEVGGTLSSITDLKIIKLDGTEMELSANPIPKKVGIKATLSESMAEEANRQAVEGAIALADASGSAVAGAFTWAADFFSVTFTPNGNLDYATSYSVNLSEETLPTLSLSKDYTGVTTFTTMAMGDVNGDGYSDALLGADSAPGGAGGGRAYIFHGSTSGIANKDLSAASTDTIINAAATGDALGSSSAFAGDINGDGYDDIIVGAPLSAGGGTDRGTAYIFLGSANGVADCDISAGCSARAVISGTTDNGEFAYSVSGAGDVNGDGYDDVVVGANGNTPYYVSIFHGGPSFTGNITPAGNANSRLIGPAAAGSFGRSVNTAGDVNGDGFSDAVVGASFTDNTGTLNTGAAYIYLGSASGVANCNMSTDPNCPHAKIVGAITNGKLGVSVANAGDTNGDGFADVIVGADHQGSVGQSFAYLFLGSTSGIDDCDIKTTPACPDATIGSKTTQDQLGISVNSAGDINGDGFADIILGAALADGAGLNRGEAYILNGSTNGIADCNLATCTPATTFTGASDSDRLGFSVN